MNHMTEFRIGVSLMLSVVSLVATAQTPRPGPPGGPATAGQLAPPSQAGATAPTNELRGPLDRLRPNYVLRPGDQIQLRAFEMEELGERPIRIDGDGFINLPVLGRLKVSGNSVEKLEADLVEALRKYVRQPQVTITVIQFSSEPIFFVGAFKAPGIYPLEGRRTLVEMMSSIGGLLPTASRRIKVTRRKEFGELPLGNAIQAVDGSGSSVEINMASLRDNVNPEEDILLKPFDVISVERAEMVYISGEVGRVGAFELNEKDSMSVLQALTLAGGVGPNANLQQIRILRPVLNSSRRAEVPLDLKQILAGRQADFPLLPNDLLYVPRKGLSKNTIGRSMVTIIPVAMSAINIVLFAALR